MTIRMTRRSLGLLLMGAWAFWSSPVQAADEFSADAARKALHRAVRFFREHCSAGGGYVYKVSSDLTLRQGEEPVGQTTAWIQAPGTPSVGTAYLEAYRLTRDPLLLEAARETAGSLLRGQLVSGGWDNQMEFDPAERKKHAYRVDVSPGASVGKLRNTTTFDDDKSQFAARFLMNLDRELEFKDAPLHEAVLYALDAFVKAQYPNGAWPQRYNEFPRADDFPVRKASIPEEWPREFSGVKYSSYYTLNDGAISDLIETMLDAWDLYKDPKYLDAARRGGDFFLLAQLPEPQPGWAQQYDLEMHPAWARKFEPPAVSGGESQGVMQTLMLLYRRTGDRKYLEPIPKALAYYHKCLLSDGRLARFYELGTNKPLYFTRDYVLTHSDDDLPTHYAFKVSGRIDRLKEQFDDVSSLPPDQLWKPSTRKPPKMSSALAQKARSVAEALDARGAWVEDGSIETRDRGDVRTKLMDSKSFCRNCITLAEYLSAAEK